MKSARWHTGAPLIAQAFLILASSALAATGPVLQLVRSGTSGTNLLINSAFEQVTNGKLIGWSEAAGGVQFPADQGRNGSRGLFCVNETQNKWTGASQAIQLRQTVPGPIVISGWSKAQDVSGSLDNNYAIYVDLMYDDGTPLWGQTARFRTGSHDWERRELVIMPEKPVRTLTLNCLFRNHTGTVWFDDVSVTQPAQPGAAVMFEGAPVLINQVRRPAGTRKIYNTDDEFSVTVTGGRVSRVKLGRSAIGHDSTTSGFLVRDAAANSDIYPIESGKCDLLGLALETNWQENKDHLAIEGALTDLQGKDRAVTLTFNLPVEAEGWTWGDDIRRTRALAGNGDYNNPVVVGCGANGLMALYPLACISREASGVAVAADMGFPAQYRLGYNAGTRQLYISYDFGLVPESQPKPGSARFRFVLYRFDGRHGFRGAFEKYTRLFPEYFRVRSQDQGIWMPFTDVGTVQDWEDFGFKYHEGNNNVPWDDAHGVLSFRYTEPMTWWMRMDKGVPRTNPEAVRIRDETLRRSDAQQRSMALASQTASMWDDAGQPNLMFQDTPWCDGAIWSLNPNPNLPIGTNGFNAATVHWNDRIKERLYGANRKGDQDGEYLDSIEGYVTADLNFRREHFRYSTVPLTFDKDTKRPALYKGLAVYEFTRWLSEDVHSLGKLMFANGVPYRFSFLCPWLDVLGTETDWLRQGKYSPASHQTLSLWRTMSGKKPYLLLLNTDYDSFTSDLVERYFQRSLFYGMFPSMFSHNASENPYWRNPKWYNRDRPLFKKYIPLIKKTAEAGWEPVTYATSGNANILIERFGPGADGSVYFTLFNESTSVQTGSFAADNKVLKRASKLEVEELLSGEKLSPPFSIALQPDTVKLLRVR